MPIPTPNEDEIKIDFITRCIDQIKDEYNLDQRVAICYREWDKHTTKIR